MFFTEMGGFKFMSGPDDCLGLGEESPVEVSAAPPTLSEPVTCGVTLAFTSPGFATLGVKLAMLPGWYIYTDVPEGQPFQQVSFEVESDQLVASEIMLIPPPNKLIEKDPFLVGYEGEVMFTQDYFILEDMADSAVKITIRFQACNAEQCEQPEEREFVVAVADETR